MTIELSTPVLGHSSNNHLRTVAVNKNMRLATLWTTRSTLIDNGKPELECERIRGTALGSDDITAHPRRMPNV